MRQDWLEHHREAAGYNLKELAEAAGIDQSYPTHIRNHGLIPSRRVVAAIGRALGREDEAMVAAGYLPTKESCLVMMLRLTVGSTKKKDKR